MKDERSILSGTEENPITVAETKWHDDGSRVESFVNYRTGAAHFAVYDARGEMVQSVHGCFEDIGEPEEDEETLLAVEPEQAKRPEYPKKRGQMLCPPAEDSLD